MTGLFGRGFVASSAIALVMSAGMSAWAAPESATTNAIAAPAPAADSVPSTATDTTPGAAIDVKALTGKDLVRAPLAGDLTGQDAVIAAKLRDLLATDLRRFTERPGEGAAVEAFYRDRGFAPLWIADGAANERARTAIAFLRRVAVDGLDPNDYPTPQFDRSSDAAAFVEDELQLTRSILTFTRHARTGRIHFTRISGAAFYDLQFPDPAKVLSTVASAPDLRAALDAYHPAHPAYRALKAKLAEARSKNNKAEPVVRIADGKDLHPGFEDMRVPALRRRLDLPNSESWHYDEALAAAVKAFQKSGGLRPDGVIGPRTLAKLNAQRAGHSEAIDTILANMERWRWMPRDLGVSHVVVNIPDYTLQVFDRGKPVWSTRIVVGKPGDLATPLISETMKYITVNPTWNVPPSIIRNEYLPVLQQDPGALARIGLKMERNTDGSIRIYQPPGERNALGRIRFNFPNKFLVYQHDTPQKHLFAKEARAYSHGCMRVQDPDEYAEVLLSLSQPNERYTAERIRAMYGKGERTIRFAREIPVHLTYQTAFVDQAGQLQIRKDVYGHDAEIMDQLRGSERRVADVPVKRNYTSNNKPVMVNNKPVTARARTRDRARDDDRPRRQIVRRAPREYERHEDNRYDRYYRYERRYHGYDYRYAGPSYAPRGFFGFPFR